MEPKVDSYRWINDVNYRYQRVDELLAYLDTFKGFGEKIKQYRALCTSLGGNYSLYGATIIYQKEGVRDSEGDYVDENGDRLPFKLFGLFPETRDDHRILNKYAFDERRGNLYQETINYPQSSLKVFPYSVLVKSFYERLSRTLIKSDFIRGEYSKVDTAIKALSGNQKTASAIAYNDLMLIDPIDWADFSIIKVSGLGVALTCVWDIVEYKIFLKKSVSEIENTVSVSSNENSRGAVFRGWHFEPIHYMKRLIRYFDTKFSDTQHNLSLRDIELDCFPRFERQQVEQVLYRAEQMGYIVEEGVGKYRLNQEKASLTLDKPVDVREVDLSRVADYVHNAYWKAEERLEKVRVEYDNALFYYSDSERLKKLIENRDMSLQFYRDNNVLPLVIGGADELIYELTVIKISGGYFVYSPDCSLYNDTHLTPDKKLKDIIESAVNRWYRVSLLNKMIDELQSGKHNPINNKIHPSENLLICTLTEPQIIILFNRLSAGRYIDSAVTLAEFSDTLLSSEPMAKPLQWLKSNRDLAYLLNTMYERKMINSRVWKSRVEKRGLFLNEKSKPLKAHDLSQATTNYQRDGNPAEATNIDTILEAVRTLKD